MGGFVDGVELDVDGLFDVDPSVDFSVEASDLAVLFSVLVEVLGCRLLFAAVSNRSLRRYFYQYHTLTAPPPKRRSTKKILDDAFRPPFAWRHQQAKKTSGPFEFCGGSGYIIGGAYIILAGRRALIRDARCTQKLKVHRCVLWVLVHRRRNRNSTPKFDANNQTRKKKNNGSKPCFHFL